MSPDRMTETLSALRTDVDRVGMADSASVRHRGNQRTRNQALGGTLAALCLVAAGVGVAGGLTGDNSAEPIPANPTVTTTQSAEPTYAIAADPFLRAEDMTDFGVYSENAPFIDAQDLPDVMPEQCAVRPGEWGAAELLANRYYSELEPSVYEYVLRFDTVAAAEQAAMKRPHDDLTSATCPQPPADDGELTVRNNEQDPGLDSASHWSRFFVPSFASESSYHEVATVQRGNVVVVLEWHAFGNPHEEAGGWAFTTETLETALDRAVAE